MKTRVTLKYFVNDCRHYNGKWVLTLIQSKLAQEVIFFRKHQNSNHDSIYFDHNLFQQVPSEKYLGMHLDAKINFQEHLDSLMSKVDKTIGLLHKPQAVFALAFPNYHL